MPSSSMALENPQSIAAPAVTQDAADHSGHCLQAPHRVSTVCGFSAGGPRDDLFLPALSDPDPCIAPRARKRRQASWISDHQETN
jgi:hypothetical protein